MEQKTKNYGCCWVCPCPRKQKTSPQEAETLRQLEEAAEWREKLNREYSYFRETLEQTSLNTWESYPLDVINWLHNGLTHPCEKPDERVFNDAINGTMELATWVIQLHHSLKRMLEYGKKIKAIKSQKGGVR